MDEPVPGFMAPVHRALTEPILLGGAPRAVAILNGTLAAALGLGLRLWLVGIVLWAIAAEIIDSCHTRILLPNDRAIEPQITAIYQRFGLNDRQIEILARATPKRDYYCQSRRGNRLFELGLGELALSICAASAKEDHTLIDHLLAEHGRDGFLETWLRIHNLDWAAELIPNLTNIAAPAAAIDDLIKEMSP